MRTTTSRESLSLSARLMKTNNKVHGMLSTTTTREYWICSIGFRRWARASTCSSSSFSSENHAFERLGRPAGGLGWGGRVTSGPQMALGLFEVAIGASLIRPDGRPHLAGGGGRRVAAGWAPGGRRVDAEWAAKQTN